MNKNVFFLLNRYTSFVRSPQNGVYFLTGVFFILTHAQGINFWGQFIFEHLTDEGIPHRDRRGGRENGGVFKSAISHLPGFQKPVGEHGDHHWNHPDHHHLQLPSRPMSLFDCYSTLRVKVLQRFVKQEENWMGSWEIERVWFRAFLPEQGCMSASSKHVWICP